MHIEGHAHIIYGYVRDSAKAPLFDAIRDKPDADVDYVHTPFAVLGFGECHGSLQRKHHVVLDEVPGKDGPVDIIAAYQYSVSSERFDYESLPLGPFNITDTYRGRIKDFLAEMGIETLYEPCWFLLAYVVS